MYEDEGLHSPTAFNSDQSLITHQISQVFFVKLSTTFLIHPIQGHLSSPVHLSSSQLQLPSDSAHSIKFYQKTTTCAPNKTVATLLLKMTARNAIKARAHSEELLERHALRDQPARASGFQSHLHLSDGEDYELDADDFDNLKHARDLRHHQANGHYDCHHPVYLGSAP
ncbi:hypothetical protein PSHT_00577 [Puccinia striiformis]|nr:hypothetical protein H4Q26_011511 [Puccinia striiformis f. sp. tritici PST-130]KNF02412.1 hypothetical protein PSTG_04320 [Puccinia striiformis f. sp. tritici PST-78]POW23135.1 hypothetical protein PSHT_00577 [Puccinia striiformis]